MIFDKQNTRLRRLTVVQGSEMNLYSTNSEEVRLLAFRNTTGKVPYFYTNDNSYTLIAESGTDVILSINNIRYLVRFVSENEHVDLLTNYNLPRTKQLKEASLNNVSVTEMLLDFRELLKCKGKDTIEKVLEWLGYNIDLVNQNKSGVYYALLKTFIEQSIDDDGFIDYEYVENDSELIDHLERALILLHEYFSAEEQIIRTTELIYQSNNPVYLNQNITNYQHCVLTCCHNTEYSITINCNIENNILENDEGVIFYQKYYDSTTSKVLHEIGFIPTHIQDVDLPYIKQDLCYTFEIQLQNLSDGLKYYHLEITDGTTTLSYDGEIENVIFRKMFIIFQPSTINIDLKMRFNDGMIETNNYTIHAERVVNEIHCLTTAQLSEDESSLIDLTPSITYDEVISYGLPNYFHHQEDIPQDLSRYYNTPSRRFLKNVVLPDLPSTANYPITLCTTLPCDLLEPYLNIVTCRYFTGDQIKWLHHGTYSDEFINLPEWLPINYHARQVNIDGILEKRIIFCGSICGYDIPINRIYIFRNNNPIKLADILCESGRPVLWSNIAITFPDDSYITYKDRDIIRSPFSYMTKNTNSCKLGDLVLLYTDKPVPYTIRDAFTNDLIQQTDQHSLIHRVTKLTSFTCNGVPVFSSIQHTK